MKGSLRISLFILLLVVLVVGFSLFSRSWLSVAAEQGPYPPPEQINNALVGEPYPLPFLSSQSSAYPPPVENIPLPTAHYSEDESYTPLLEIVAEIELRKSIGFRSDTEYVKAVRSSDDMVVNERFGGIALTPAEAHELEARLNLEKDGDVLLDFFEKELEFQDAFGGIYLDHAAGSEDYTAGGKLVLQLVRDYEKINDIPAKLPSIQYPERLRIEWVDFSGERLEQEFWAISNAATQHPELRAVAIDGRNNQVEVLIAPSDAWRISDGVVEKASLPNDLATLVADPSVIVWEGEIEEEPVAVRGGDSWSNTSGGGDCTLGFKIEYNNTYSMLTAGHCISALGMSAGGDVYHNTTKIGTYSGVYKDGASSSSGTGIDAAILYMNDFWTAYEDVIDYSSYRDIVGSTDDYVAGYWRCRTGQSSGTNCGEIKCTSITYQSGGRWYTDMFTIDPDSVGGDSGSPVYRPETNSLASVTGVVRSRASGATCMNGWDTSASKWHNIRDYWSLTLIAGDAYLPLILK
jgi:hypothetical protein